MRLMVSLQFDAIIQNQRLASCTLSAVEITNMYHIIYIFVSVRVDYNKYCNSYLLFSVQYFYVTNVFDIFLFVGSCHTQISLRIGHCKMKMNENTYFSYFA